ncbi:phage tail assembly chaperone [Fusibacter bizertensis]
MSLSAFLAQNAETIEVMAYVASRRFKEKGKAVAWQLKPVTSEVDEQLRKSCTRQVEIPGKRGRFTKDTDYDKYLGKLAVECIIYPDLNSQELQDSYKVMGADALLKKMLLPGELQDLFNKIQEINGYETTMDELVDEAKN